MHARHLKALRKEYAKRLQTTPKARACQAGAAEEAGIEPFLADGSRALR
jgi:hypothetical protein